MHIQPRRLSPWLPRSGGVLLTLCALLLGVAVTGAGCGDDPAADDAVESADGVIPVGYDDYGRPRLDEVPADGKEDNAVGRKGLPLSVDTSDTAVWEVRNKWNDTNTAAARAAGVAWEADSGLDWNQKFSRWVGAMERTSGHNTYYDTFTLTTPWGKTLPAPSLECAEVAIFLRVTFASWYQLPFFLEGTDGKGNRLYFGHFGARTAAGRYGRTPLYKGAYKDYSHMSAADIERDGWPTDAKLAARKIPGNASDIQGFLGDEAHAGAYFDEIFLNKRVGYFMTLILAYFGSANLADAANTFHLKPEVITTGDLLIERWQRTGIGHVMVIKSVDSLPGDRLDARVASGSMPRRQPKWDDAAASKRFFSLEECGGPGTNSDGDRYAALGGGVRRFRTAEAVGGRWTNVVPTSQRDHRISDRNLDAIEARPARFGTLLGELTPEEMRASLLLMVNDAREHLRRYPASCSARIRREDAFSELYALCSQHFNMSREQVDRQYRILEDYVFARLVYEESKTCCWNSTNAAMFQIIMDYNNSLVYDKETGVCTEPVVFKATAGGYQTFADHAATMGDAGVWVPWSEDERCEQRDVSDDTEAVHEWIPLCVIFDSVLDIERANTCSDSFDGNDSALTAATIGEGSYASLQACAGVQDWFKVQAPAGTQVTLTARFRHADGDLDMQAYDSDGRELGQSAGTADEEVISAVVPAAGLFLKVYGYSDAANTYELDVEFGGAEEACSDVFVGNSNRERAAAVAPGSHTDLQVCSGSEDWYRVDLAAGTQVAVDIRFSHAQGDLDLEVQRADGHKLGSSAGSSDEESVQVAVPEGGLFVRVYGYQGAANTYSLKIEQR